MKKWMIAGMLSVVLLVGGCGGRESAEADPGERSEDKIQIGLCFDSFVIERWQRDRDVFVSTAKELGAEVNVQNANGDLEEQKKQIQYFIDKKADVIVIICIDSDGLKGLVDKARSEGIKVVAYDRLINNSNVDLYISFDNAKVGGMMADALVEEGLSGGNVLMIGGSPTDNNVSLVEGRFKSICRENNMRILDIIHAEGWKPEIGGAYIYENYNKVMQADAIMCGNDSIASQVVHALSERRLAGKIAVVGQDADLEACQRIVEGTQVMTVYKPVEKLAQAAAEYSIRLAKGEKLTQGEENDGVIITLMNDGTYDVPYAGLEPFSVNEDNINEVIINSGFHLKEDVYLNVPDKMP